MSENGTWLTPEDRNKVTEPYILKSCLTNEEVKVLAKFAKGQLIEPNNVDTPDLGIEASEVTQKKELYNRPDAWDSAGAIDKLQNIFRESLKEHYFLVGVIEPKKFIVMRTDELQSYKEEYGNFEENGVVTYTALMTLNSEFKGGETLYPRSGAGHRITPGDLIIHRNEADNDWVITEVNVGTRFDLMLVVIERPVSVNYDEFEIEQSVDDGIDYQ